MAWSAMPPSRRTVAGSRVELGDDLLDERPIERVKRGDEASREFDAARRDQHADGGGDAGAAREDHLVEVQEPRERVGMHRPGAAEGDHAVAVGVGAGFGDMHACGRRHVVVDDAARSPRPSRHRPRPSLPPSRASAARARVRGRAACGRRGSVRAKDSRERGRRRSRSASSPPARSRRGREPRRRCADPRARGRARQAPRCCRRPRRSRSARSPEDEAAGRCPS